MRKKKVLPQRPKATIEETIVASVRYYEALYMVRDKDGDAIYTGSREKAERIVKLLNNRGKRKK
jgi:hypothetical protein